MKHTNYLYIVYHSTSLNDPKIKIAFIDKNKVVNWLKKKENDPQYIEWEVWQTKLGVSTDDYSAKYLGDAEQFLKKFKKNPTK